MVGYFFRFRVLSPRSPAEPLQTGPPVNLAFILAGSRVFHGLSSTARLVPFTIQQPFKLHICTLPAFPRYCWLLEACLFSILTLDSLSCNQSLAVWFCFGQHTNSPPSQTSSRHKSSDLSDVATFTITNLHKLLNPPKFSPLHPISGSLFVLPSRRSATGVGIKSFLPAKYSWIVQSYPSSKSQVPFTSTSTQSSLTIS